METTGIQQGWQCPVCKRVYSPSTPMCFFCGKIVNVSMTTGTTDQNMAKSVEDALREYDIVHGRKG